MAEDFLNQLCTEYQLGIPILTEPAQVGVDSENFILTTTNGKYFVKPYKMQVVQHPATTHKFINLLASKQVPVIQPLVNFNGLDHATDSSGRIYAVFPFVSKIFIKRETATINQAKELGKFLLNLHAKIDNDPKDLRFKKLFEVWDNQPIDIPKILEVISQKNKKDDLDEKIEKRLKEKLNSVRKSYTTDFDSKTLIHGDYHIENVFFNETGGVELVYDFDHVRFDSRAWEIVWCLFVSFFETSCEKSLDEATAFFKAAVGNGKITKVEIEKAFERYFNYISTYTPYERLYYLDGKKSLKSIIQNDLNRVEFLKKNFGDFVGFFTKNF